MTEPSIESNAGAATVGARLRATREQANLGLRDVAAVTKIQTAFLQYIEEDRFDEFPAEVFARGFVRNYARELGLDADAIVEEYRRQRGLNASAPTTVTAQPEAPATVEAPASRFTETSRLGQFAYAAALVVIVLGAALAVLVVTGNDTAETSAVYAPAGEADAWRPAPEGHDDWQTYREN